MRMSCVIIRMKDRKVDYKLMRLLEQGIVPVWEHIFRSSLEGDSMLRSYPQYTLAHVSKERAQTGWPSPFASGVNWSTTVGPWENMNGFRVRHFFSETQTATLRPPIERRILRNHEVTPCCLPISV